MSTLQVIVLIAYSVGMSLGQLLFKYAALSLSSSGSVALTTGRLFQLGLNLYFLSAMLMYLGLSVLWVWILTFTPLSRAYPFVALAFIITPIVGHFVFMEILDLQFYFGLFFIVLGLILVIR